MQNVDEIQKDNVELREWVKELIEERDALKAQCEEMTAKCEKFDEQQQYFRVWGKYPPCE